jgi:hypothetical protein
MAPYGNDQVTLLSDQETSWINDLAGRLRLIQGDASSVDAKQRCEFLQEEVERSLKNVALANRKRFLQALLARFPVAGRVVSSLTPPPVAAPASPPPAPVDETPEQLLERLLAMLPELSEEKRSDLARQLFESELVRAYRSALVLEISEESQRALGLQAGQQPRLERIVQTTVVFLQALSGLDQSALKTLEVLSSRSPLLQRSESLRGATTRYLVGEGESLELTVRTTRNLWSALLEGFGHGPRDFGKQYVERFSPSEIESVVKAEGGGGVFGRNMKERCWDKYCDLAKDYATADLVDRRIKDCVAAVVQRKADKAASGIR